jgi:hypothetical protein
MTSINEKLIIVTVAQLFNVGKTYMFPWFLQAMWLECVFSLILFKWANKIFDPYTSPSDKVEVIPQ